MERNLVCRNYEDISRKQFCFTSEFILTEACLIPWTSYSKTINGKKYIIGTSDELMPGEIGTFQGVTCIDYETFIKSLKTNKTCLKLDNVSTSDLLKEINKRLRKELNVTEIKK